MKKKLHIILDLDNTLIRAYYREQKTKCDFKFYVPQETFYVYKRPFLDDFLKKIFKKAKTVSVWTSATKPYCNAILKNIMSLKQRQKLRFVWSRKQTSCVNDTCYLKDLSKVFSKYKDMNNTNTFLLDDNKNHSLASSGNIYFIKPWKTYKDIYDNELIKVLELF